VRDALAIDPHVAPERGHEEREDPPPDPRGALARSHGRHARARISVREVGRPEEPPQLGRDLVVEVRLDRERALALRRILGVERPLRRDAIELGEDARRARDRRAVDHEHRQLALPAHDACAEEMERRHERLARVREALAVEGPAHLLVVVRDLEVEQMERRQRASAIRASAS
jgi:hypothetical protein